MMSDTRGQVGTKGPPMLSAAWHQSARPVFPAWHSRQRWEHALLVPRCWLIFRCAEQFSTYDLFSFTFFIMEGFCFPKHIVPDPSLIATKEDQEKCQRTNNVHSTLGSFTPLQPYTLTSCSCRQTFFFGSFWTILWRLNSLVTHEFQLLQFHLHKVFFPSMIQKKNIYIIITKANRQKLIWASRVSLRILMENVELQDLKLLLHSVITKKGGLTRTRWCALMNVTV